MKESRILYFALGVLMVTSIGAVTLHDNGVEFPDGSLQVTAAGFTAANAVQGRVFLEVDSAPTFCSNTKTLYTVPAGKRLVVEWLAVESFVFGGAGAYHPVEVAILTHDGSSQIYHPLVRLENPIAIGSSFFTSARWSGQVRLYSEANQPFQASFCFDGEFLDNQTVGSVSFSGYLIDV